MSHFDSLNLSVDASSGPVDITLPSSILSTIKQISYTKSDNSINQINILYKSEVIKTLVSQGEVCQFKPSGLGWVEV